MKVGPPLPATRGFDRVQGAQSMVLFTQTQGKVCSLSILCATQYVGEGFNRGWLLFMVMAEVRASYQDK
jgi:hypothetical protein